MFKAISIRISKEISHFHSLGVVARKLLLSFILFSAAYPLMTIFVNAYVWRQTSNLAFVAVLSLMRYVSYPIGFYFNMLALRKVKPPRLYFIGMLSFSISMLLIILIPQLTLGGVVLAGLIRGIGSSFFWANRNLFIIKATNKSNRILYSGLERSMTSLVGITVPLIAGWLLVLGERFGLYSIGSAYQISAVIALFLLLASGSIMLDSGIEVSSIPRLTYKNPSASWNNSRAINYLFGFMNGVMNFLPSVAILILIGAEESIGTVSSLATLVSSGVIYIIGRRAAITHRANIYATGALLYVLGAIVFGFSFSAIGLLALIAGHIVGKPLRQMAINTVSQDATDHESDLNQGPHRYSLVFDRELFLNLGRITGIAIFFLILNNFSEVATLRITPFITSFALIALFFPLRKLVKLHNN